MHHEQQRNSFFLIDGHNVIYRSYFAIQNMHNPQGMHVGGLFGFIRTLLSILKIYTPEKCIVAFDSGEATSRDSIYASYKSNRDAQPIDLSIQIEEAVNFCKLIGIPTISHPGAEADDIIFSLAQLYSDTHDIYILSSDKDFLQLVNNVTYVIVPNKLEEPIDELGVINKIGVRPDQVVDFLALVGDSVDNIPGVPKIGVKTAAKLLQEFESIDHMQASMPSSNKWHDKIVHEYSDLLRLNQRLIALAYVPAVDAIPIAPTATQNDELRSWLQHHRFSSIEKDLIKLRILNDKEQDGSHIIQLKPGNIHDILKHAPLFCCAGMSEFIDAHRITEPRIILANEDSYTVIDHIGIIEHREQILHALRSCYCYDLKAILLVLKYQEPMDKLHIDFPIDIKALAHLFNPETSVDIASIIQTHLGACLEKLSLQHFPNNNVPIHISYGIKTGQKMVALAKEMDLWDLYQQVEAPMAFVLADIELNGIYVDQQRLLELESSIHQEIAYVSKAIHDVVGTEINLNSPIQIKRVLNELNIHKKNISTTKGTFLSSLEQTHPVVTHIIQFRSLGKILAAIKGLLSHINPHTNRIHASFDSTGTATGRLSCKSPNLQNIPIKTTYGEEIRNAFTTTNSQNVIISADFSQIEMRVLAHICQDPTLIGAFLDNADVHTNTASKLFGIPQDQVSGEQRSIAKTVNFGIIYGQTEFGLSQIVGVSKSEASEFISMYFKQFSKVEQTILNIIEYAKKHKCVKTLLGYRRPLPMIDSTNKIVKARQERCAINTVIQGYAAVLFKLALIKIHSILKKQGYHDTSRLLLNVHDEIVIETEQKVVQMLNQEIKLAMESTELSVPTPVNISIGHSWGNKGQ